jgi:Domain of unknown function (DUF4129)
MRWLVPVLLAAVLCGTAHAQPASAASAPSREQVDDAARALRDIPGLHGERSVRQLHFKDGERKPPPDTTKPEWLRWLGDFVAWFNDAGRWLVWLLIALALGFALLRLRRWFVGRGPLAINTPLTLPTQVRGLDISPDTLPADVGAAAWALWQQGQRLPALSLLYRGALSRLVHGHGVPIRASSTEGDCLRLAAPLLRAEASRYLHTLVGLWAQAVYAARWPTADDVRPLCEGFSLLDGGAKP